MSNGLPLEGLVCPTGNAVIDDRAQTRGDEIRVPVDRFAGDDRRSREVQVAAQDDHLGEAAERFLSIRRLVVASLFGRHDHVETCMDVIGEHEVAGSALHERESLEVLLIRCRATRRLAGDEEDILTLLPDAGHELGGSFERERDGQRGIESTLTRSHLRYGRTIRRDARGDEVFQSGRQDDAARVWKRDEMIDQTLDIGVRDQILESSRREKRLLFHRPIRSTDGHAGENEVKSRVFSSFLRRCLPQQGEELTTDGPKGASRQGKVGSDIDEGAARDQVEVVHAEPPCGEKERWWKGDPDHIHTIDRKDIMYNMCL